MGADRGRDLEAAGGRRLQQQQVEAAPHGRSSVQSDRVSSLSEEACEEPAEVLAFLDDQDPRHGAVIENAGMEGPKALV